MITAIQSADGVTHAIPEIPIVLFNSIISVHYKTVSKFPPKFWCTDFYIVHV